MDSDSALNAISSGLVGDSVLVFSKPVDEMAMAPCTAGPAPSSPDAPAGRAGCALSSGTLDLDSPSHSSTQFLRNHVLCSLDADLEITPDSISRLSCKYHLDKPGRVEEAMGDVDFVSDDHRVLVSGSEYASDQIKEASAVEDADNVPLLYALQQVLAAEDTLLHINSLGPEHRNMVLIFMDCCYCDLSGMAKEDFRSSYPMNEAILNNSSNELFEALRLLVVAKYSQPHVVSLSPDGRNVIFINLCFLLETKTNFLSCQYNDLDSLMVGLLNFDKSKCSLRLNGRSVQGSATQDGTWKHVKSRRQRKDASKKSTGSSCTNAAFS